MDSKKLMIGDWVLLKSNGVVPDTNFQISGIDEDGLFVRDCDNFIGYDEVKAIPLTEDILKANGFEYMNGYFRLMASSYVYARKREGFGIVYFGISIQIPSGMIMFSKILYYVHELQHALHICELTELADNFKLE